MLFTERMFTLLKDAEEKADTLALALSSSPSRTDKHTLNAYLALARTLARITKMRAFKVLRQNGE